MKNISQIVNSVLKMFVGDDMPEINDTISSNLELRLILNVNMMKPYREAKKDFLRNYMDDLLVFSFGNVSMAARKAKLNRRHLHRMINELNIDPSTHRKELLKPVEYVKSNVHDIIEETLTDEYESIHSNINDISRIIAENIDGPVSYEEALDFFEKEYFRNALEENNFDIAKTAKFTRTSERTLYRKINKLDIACT